MRKLLKAILAATITLLLTVTTAYAASNLWEYYDGNLPSVQDRADTYLTVTQNIDEYTGTAYQNEEFLRGLQFEDFVLGSGGITRRAEPAVSSTDNAIVRFDGTSGSALQNSGVIIDDSDNVTGLTSISVDGTATSTFGGGDIEVDGLSSISYIETSSINASSTTATSTFAGGLTVDTDDFLVDPDSNNVGIGTTTPYARLSVVGEVVSDSFTATSTTATSTFAGGLTVDTSDFVVDPDANRVGIGTTTPSQLLHVFSNSVPTTTVEFGDLASSTAKTCFNVNATDGTDASFYFNPSGIVFETNACK